MKKNKAPNSNPKKPQLRNPPSEVEHPPKVSTAVIDESHQAENAKEKQQTNTTNIEENREHYKTWWAKNSVWIKFIGNTAVALGTLFAVIISALNLSEIKKQFSIQNTPYLQIKTFKVSNFKIGEPIETTYELYNIGNSPVRVLQNRTVVAIRSVAPSYNTINDFEDIDSVNTIVSKDFPIKRKNPIPNRRVTPSQDSLVNRGLFRIFILGWFKYENVVDGKISTYHYMVETRPEWEDYSFNFILNQNIRE